MNIITEGLRAVQKPSENGRISSHAPDASMESRAVLVAPVLRLTGGGC